MSRDNLPAQVASPETTQWPWDGHPLRRPVSFMLERRSDEDVYRHWHLIGPKWVSDGLLTGVIAPQWDPGTGRVEAVIPLSAISSTPPILGQSWASLVIVLADHDSASDTWTDDGRAVLHYRISRPEDMWIYGNIQTL